MSVDVTIVVITFDSERDLRTSLDSALVQEGVTSELIVVDNGSRDGTLKIVRSYGDRLRLIEPGENTGFAGGMNRGIDAGSGRYVLALNPDCRLQPDFCAVLGARLDDRPDVGSASGRLLRGGDPGLVATDTIDSVGLYFTASGRHFDRGAGEPATGRYLQEEPVFGVTGAAGFYRREALDAVRISTGWFDDDFFAYREDADLAWRLQHAGWGCLYVPTAIAVHRRANLPERRAQMSELVNYHSVKNRWLLRINNQTRAEFWRTLVPTFARDAVVVGGCLLRERSSLPAFGWLWSNRRRLWAKRRQIQSLPRRR
ncbi:MAG: glycosyltransferase family 2 protein [Chloroflexota bacterium]|jgi:GT2 family glycosyltransferase